VYEREEEKLKKVGPSRGDPNRQILDNDISHKKVSVEPTTDIPQTTIEPTQEKKQFLASMRDLMKEVSLDEIDEILSATIKHDRTSKLITFLSMVLTYTEEDQQTVTFKSESSRGKSYIPLEIAQYFPQDDIQTIAYASPAAFFHQHGLWIKETKTVWIDLERKILIFLDQPHDLLLQRLRPLLSHDQKELNYKITDKTQKKGLKTKNILINGYPTVIFCTAKQNIDEQDRTRVFILSPGATQDKLKSSIALLSLKLSNTTEFKKNLEQDEKREWLQARIQGIRDARINSIIIPNHEEIYTEFIVEHPYLTPRHQRDFKRLVALIKAHALLNCYTRRNPNNDHSITVNQTDILEGFKLYNEIVAANELGLSPEIYEIWEQTIKPKLKARQDIGLRIDEVQNLYRKQYHRLLSEDRLKDIRKALKSAGLIFELKDSDDKRKIRLFLLNEEEGEEEPEQQQRVL